MSVQSVCDRSLSLSYVQLCVRIQPVSADPPTAPSPAVGSPRPQPQHTAPPLSGTVIVPDTRYQYLSDELTDTRVNIKYTVSVRFYWTILNPLWEWCGSLPPSFSFTKGRHGPVIPGSSQKIIPQLLTDMFNFSQDMHRVLIVLSANTQDTLGSLVVFLSEGQKHRAGSLTKANVD